MHETTVICAYSAWRLVLGGYHIVIYLQCNIRIYLYMYVTYVVSQKNIKKTKTKQKCVYVNIYCIYVHIST